MIFSLIHAQGSKVKAAIGRSENKTLTKFSSYENEVRPGVVMTGILFYVCRG